MAVGRVGSGRDSFRAHGRERARPTPGHSVFGQAEIFKIGSRSMGPSAGPGRAIVSKSNFTKFSVFFRDLSRFLQEMWPTGHDFVLVSGRVFCVGLGPSTTIFRYSIVWTKG